MTFDYINIRVHIIQVFEKYSGLFKKYSGPFLDVIR